MSTETRMEQMMLFPVLTAAGERRSEWAKGELARLPSLSPEELEQHFFIEGGMIDSPEDIDYLLSHSHRYGASPNGEGLPRIEILLGLRTAYEQLLRSIAKGERWPSREVRLRIIHECIRGRATVFRLLKNAAGCREERSASDG